MCEPASGVFTKGHVAHWLKTSDSHEDIIREHDLHADGVGGPNIVRFEISPPAGNLSLPLRQWRYRVDQVEVPDWYDVVEAEKAARVMLKEWAAVKLTGWKLDEAFNPVNPLKLERKPLTEDEMRRLLGEWASVWASVQNNVWGSVRDSIWGSVGDSVWISVRDSVVASVGDSVWISVRDSVVASVGDSVRASVRGNGWNSVRASVWAYVGGWFPNIKTWKYAEKLGSDPWRPLLTLWYAGYVPSFDGKMWRLHAGEKADVVFTVHADELTGPNNTKE